MGKGYLTIRLTAGDSALPVPSAKANIFDMDGNLLDTVFTNDNGVSDRVELPAPPAETQFDPELAVKPYSRYVVELTAQGYNTVVVNGAQIYDESSSQLPIDMVPHAPGQPPKEIDFEIGDNALEHISTMQEPPPPSMMRIHREVFIPTYVTVHMGIPTSSARNVTVKFIDYVKNVASSEVFPDWPYNALRANIHAQISLTLNRVFTEWYRSKGYNFDITSSTRYDQYFVEGRNIYDSVSAIADEIFNSYVVRPPGIEPYYTEYCSGTTVTCPGLKQWETVTLSNQGMNYLQILRHYYGQSISIQTTNNIQTPYESFPGNLTIGSSGEGVLTIQSQLARIRRNYPRIPAFTVDGAYGSSTAAAVREFQSIFGLPLTGTVSRRTWYQISYIYAAVAKLAELGGEGHRPPTTPPPPTGPVYPGAPLRLGSSGSSVTLMQQYLNVIGTAYPAISRPVADGAFGPATQAAVTAFQRQFGLTQDGIIGPLTWQRIVAVYDQVHGGAERPPYPGTPLRVGSKGSAVTTLQQNINRVAATNSAIPRVATDGAFGPATQAAVIAFQRSAGITPDGIVGPVTWDRLMRA